MSAAKGDKFESGSSKRKRKRKKAEEKLVSSMRGSLLRHFTSMPSVSDPSTTSTPTSIGTDVSMELQHVAPESDTQFQEQNIVSESEGLQDLSDDCDAAVATLKPLCETRWESRVSSIKAIRYQIGEVYDALIDLSLDNKDAKCVTEAAALAKEIKNFKFLVTLVIWYNILTQINLSSKLLQKQNMNLHEAVSTLQKTNEFLRSYKESGLPGSIATAKVLADELEMTPEEMTFPREADVRRRRKKTQFSYEAPDEPVENPEDDYRINFFNVLMDQAIMSFEERFSQLMKFQDIFGFLFNIQAYKEIHSDCSASAELLKLCLSLQQAMSEKGDGTVDDESDIDGQSLYDEVKTLANILPQNSVSPLDVLRYMVSNGLQELLPNLTVALRILLTVPVTVASGERSFSRLKLIKTYLRSTMSQDRLVGLAILSIENDVAQTLDFADLLSKFASQKARKISM